MNWFFSRPYGNHNYEYPDLPGRPPSDSAISLNEKCQNFLNNKNFEPDHSITGSQLAEHSPRRISDPGTSRARAKTVESVCFEGPLSGNLSRTADPLPLYDVPRTFEDNCYDVPPRPVPVSFFIQIWIVSFCRPFNSTSCKWFLSS